MQCLKTGCDIKINDKVYRGDLYKINEGYAVKVNPQPYTNPEIQAEMLINVAVAEIKTMQSYLLIDSYDHIEFCPLFVGEVLDSSRGHFIPEKYHSRKNSF